MDLNNEADRRANDKALAAVRVGEWVPDHVVMPETRPGVNLLYIAVLLDFKPVAVAEPRYRPEGPATEERTFERVTMLEKRRWRRIG